MTWGGAATPPGSGFQGRVATSEVKVVTSRAIPPELDVAHGRVQDHAVGPEPHVSAASTVVMDCAVCDGLDLDRSVRNGGPCH